jgi:hypothetical protein
VLYSTARSTLPRLEDPPQPVGESGAERLTERFYTRGMSPVVAGIIAFTAAVIWIVFILAIINHVSPTQRFILFLFLVFYGALCLGLSVFHAIVR